MDLDFLEECRVKKGGRRKQPVTLSELRKAYDKVLEEYSPNESDRSSAWREKAENLLAQIKTLETKKPKPPVEDSQARFYRREANKSHFAKAAYLANQSKKRNRTLYQRLHELNP